MYSNMLYEQLDEANVEFVGLLIFVFLTTILTIVEGIYKAPTLLFNCKDDNMMFSLPIKKRTVLFVRILKFYIFELLYNSMFLLPAMVAYIRWAQVDWTYYLASAVGLLVFPIIPIVFSCIIGMITSSISAKFKKKNIVQILITFVLLIGVLYLSFNLQTLMAKIAEHATSITEVLTKLYFPAGLFTNMITNFNIVDLLILVGSNIGIFAVTIFVLSKIYFKISSSVKTIKSGKTSNKPYVIKTTKPLAALVKKEFKKFMSSTTFVVNAAFGLVLFLIGCGVLTFNNSLIETFSAQFGITTEQVIALVPLMLIGFIIFSSLMTSITSSMISLEGRTFNILKSLPTKPYTIIKAKVLTALIVMIPCFLIGDAMVIIKYGCNLPELLLVLAASIIVPIFAETIGIVINLKYPKLDAINDAEVVKQSMSSSVAVFLGLGLSGLSVFGLVQGISMGLEIVPVMAIAVVVYALLDLALYLYLKKNSQKKFNEINV
jgi:ABC-2 type transport system permease protein